MAEVRRLVLGDVALQRELLAVEEPRRVAVLLVARAHQAGIDVDLDEVTAALAAARARTLERWV